MPLRIAALVAAAALTLPAAAYSAVVPGQSIDGPSNDIKQFGDVDVAPDGTGAIAYIKSDGGVDHVFVSRIANGQFGAPERADIGIATASSRPRVAASNGGKLVVVFLNNNIARAAVVQGSGQSFTGSQFTTGNPWISVDVDASPAGQAYATGTENVGGGNVHAFRLDGTAWSHVGGTQLDNVAGSAAGGSMEQDEPQIAVTNDGSAVAAWPEVSGGGTKEVFARRLAGTTPGPAAAASIPSLDGVNHDANSSVDSVNLAADGTGAAWLAFREEFKYGAQNRPRILVRRLVGNAFEAHQVVDGLPAVPDNGGERPRIAVNDAGQGLVSSHRQLSSETWGSSLSAGTWAAGTRLDAPPSDGVLQTHTALGANGAGAFAWQHRPNAGADYSIQARTSVAGARSDIIPVSNPALGTAGTPVASADANGNVVVAYMQGAAATSRIAAAIIDGPPTAQPDPGTTGGATPPDTTGPFVTATKLFPNKFAIGRGTPASLNPSRVRLGTTIRFVLSEDSRVRFLFERPTVGRRVGSSCVRPTRRNRTRRRCTRWVRDGSFTLARKVGVNRVRFSGRLTARRKLRLGKHRVTLQGTDAAGNVGTFQRRPLTIVRRR